MANKLNFTKSLYILEVKLNLQSNSDYFVSIETNV